MFKVTFEQTECSRCGGSGHYSWNQIHGSVCYGCGGSGKKLTKVGDVAKKEYDARMSIPACELIPGQIVMFPELSGRHTRRTILSVEDAPDMKWSESGIQKTAPVVTLEFKGGRWTVGRDRPVKLALNSTTKERSRMAAEGLKGAAFSDVPD